MYCQGFALREYTQDCVATLLVAGVLRLIRQAHSKQAQYKLHDVVYPEYNRKGAGIRQIYLEHGRRTDYLSRDEVLRDCNFQFVRNW